MNRTTGMISAAVNCAAVAAFALSMILGSSFGGYVTSMVIAFSFVPMMCAFCGQSSTEKKSVGYASVAFAAMYGTIILLVYFAQFTSVRLSALSEEAAMLLDYQQFGLFFSYNMLGYGLMALSTFFAGFTVTVKTKSDRWLRALLLIHGVFFIPCLIIPMLGLFSAASAGSTLAGVAILCFWCAYFIPVDVLTFLYFRRTRYKKLLKVR